MRDISSKFYCQFEILLGSRIPGYPTISRSALHPAKLHLMKLKPPVFDGDHTKWLLFKAKSRDIVVDGAGYSDTQQGHVLRNLIPMEAQERVDHLKFGSEMINISDELYGDAATSVSILVNKLLHLRLTKMTDYDKML